MLSKEDVEQLKSKVESAMEVLLRAADERVSWKQSGATSTPETPVYAFLPGVYTSMAAQAASAQPHQQDENANDASTKMTPKSSNSQQPSPLPSIDATSEGDGSKTRIILHGDNTFEYVWTMKRGGAQARRTSAFSSPQSASVFNDCRTMV
ncbi:hypothetical protein ON010_g15082 [Phytophthora cinnamomi]|nr:hypothetical protein ON010_g15082 [Phytophthora cinnamomi]